MNSVQRASDESTAIPFHRHCQKTVLSAYGPDGQGATWNVIDSLVLPNLQSDWKSYFTQNTNNITQDLAAILKLIDKIAVLDYKIQLKDPNGTNIGNPVRPNSSKVYELQAGRKVELKVNGSSAFKFNTMVSESGYDKLNVELGRNIELDIGGKTLTFNTLVERGTDRLSVSLDQRKVSFTRDWATVAQTDVVVPSGTSTTDLDINLTSYNLLPWIGGGEFVGPQDQAGERHNLKVNITNAGHIQRVNFKEVEVLDWEITLGGNYGNGRNLGQNIVSCEVHIHNMNDGSETPHGTYGHTIHLPVPHMTGYATVPLTDRLTVEMGKTNVYVFRIDKGQVSSGTAIIPPTMTYSLAYIY